MWVVSKINPKRKRSVRRVGIFVISLNGKQVLGRSVFIMCASVLELKPLHYSNIKHDVRVCVFV